MNDTLKVAGRIGAELGAAKAENEKLRGLLERIRTTCCQVRDAQDLDTAPGLSAAESLHEQIEKLDAALSQQADPCGTCEPEGVMATDGSGPFDCPDCGKKAAARNGSEAAETRAVTGLEGAAQTTPDTYTAVDMATAAAQGFRDGQAAVEQAAVQDELWAVHAQGPDELYAAFSREDAEQHAAALNALPMPAGIQVSAVVIASPWSAAEHWKYLAEQEREHAAELKARAAQTEQHPMAYAVFAANGNVVCFSTQRDHPSLTNLESEGKAVISLAPIAQTAPQGKFRMGDLVKKSTGSEWVGRVVGWYSTGQTPEGYAVESEVHAGSVQIYPAKALEAVE